MRKIFVCAFGAFLMVGSAAGFTGCGGHSVKRPHYSIKGELFPEEGRLVAEMEVTVPNCTEDAFESLPFELWANAYREGAKYAPVSQLYQSAAYYDGSSYGGISVTSVEGAAGFEIGGEDENILSVALNEPLYPDETVALSISFEVTLASVNHRLGIGENNVTLANFYPVLCARGESGFLEYVYANNGDPFVTDSSDYDIALTFPEDYKVAYSGEGSVSVTGGKKTLVASAEAARDVAFVFGKNMNCIEQTVEGTAVEYWYIKDDVPEQTFKAAADSLTYFSKTFGDYGYPKYAVVQTDFPFGGMEYSGLAMIATGLTRTEIPGVVAHETAHQWWYSMVGSNQFETPWLDEGLAEYSSALFLGEFPEYGVTYENFIAQCESGYRTYFSVKQQISGEADTGMNKTLTSFSGEYEYRNLAYDKGVIMLDRVRSATGDRAFFAGLKRYFENYSGKIAAPEDLFSSFRGSGTEALFRSFTDGKCVI